MHRTRKDGYTAVQIARIGSRYHIGDVIRVHTVKACDREEMSKKETIRKATIVWMGPRFCVARLPSVALETVMWLDLAGRRSP